MKEIKQTGPITSMNDIQYGLERISSLGFIFLIALDIVALIWISTWLGAYDTDEFVMFPPICFISTAFIGPVALYNIIYFYLLRVKYRRTRFILYFETIFAFVFLWCGLGDTTATIPIYLAFIIVDILSLYPIWRKNHLFDLLYQG